MGLTIYCVKLEFLPSNMEQEQNVGHSDENFRLSCEYDKHAKEKSFLKYIFKNTYLEKNHRSQS